MYSPPRAIVYLEGKISSLSGDIRKALDVCRRSLELAETQARKQVPPRCLSSPTQIGQVDLPQIRQVVNQVYGS